MKKLKKQLALMLTLLCMSILIPQMAFAAGKTDKASSKKKSAGQEQTTELSNVVDNYDLFSDEEESELSQKMKEISDRQQCQLVVVTVSKDDLEGKSTMEYADDYFDYNGYGYGDDHSGVLLLFAMENSEHGDFWISTTGYGITAFTDAGLDYIKECFTPDLKDHDFAQAVNVFAEECDAFLTQAKTGQPYDSGNLPKEDFPWLRNILIALGVGLVVGFFVTSVMREKLKTVKPKKSASNYVKNDSMHVTSQNDIFLYEDVTRTEIPKESESSSSGSSTHTSSSGTTHGGSGGSF